MGKLRRDTSLADEACCDKSELLYCLGFHSVEAGQLDLKPASNN